MIPFVHSGHVGSTATMNGCKWPSVVAFSLPRRFETLQALTVPSTENNLPKMIKAKKKSATVSEKSHLVW